LTRRYYVWEIEEEKTMKVCLVDGDTERLWLSADLCKRNGWEVLTFESLAEAIDCTPDVFVIDATTVGAGIGLGSSYRTAASSIAQLADLHPGTPVVVTSIMGRFANEELLNEVTDYTDSALVSCVDSVD